MAALQAIHQLLQFGSIDILKLEDFGYRDEELFVLTGVFLHLHRQTKSNESSMQEKDANAILSISSETRIGIYVGLLMSSSNCLALDPDFIKPDFSDSNLESPVTPDFSTGTRGTNTSGIDTNAPSTTSDTSDSSGDTSSETVNDTIVGQDNSNDGGTAADESTTTEGIPSTDDTSTTGSETSNDSSTESSGTSSETSGETGSESGDSTGSNDSGTEPCVPQLCFSVNADQTYDNSKWTLSYIYGSPFSFTSDRRVTGAEVFTGEKTGPASLQIWSNDGNNNRPSSQIAGENWSMVSQNGWQGVSFESSVSTTADTTYWLVFSAPYRSQVPITAFGQIVRVAASSDGGNQWIISDEINEPMRWMYKVYCCENGF